MHPVCIFHELCCITYARNYHGNRSWVFYENQDYSNTVLLSQERHCQIWLVASLLIEQENNLDYVESLLKSQMPSKMKNRLRKVLNILWQTYIVKENEPWSWISFVRNEFWIRLKVFRDRWKTRFEDAVASDKCANVILLKLSFQFHYMEKNLKCSKWNFHTWNHIIRKYKFQCRLIFQHWWRYQSHL